MWSGCVIDIHDGHDLEVNVVFQFMHLNKIITRLKCLFSLEIYIENIGGISLQM